MSAMKSTHINTGRFLRIFLALEAACLIAFMICGSRTPEGHSAACIAIGLSCGVLAVGYSEEPKATTSEAESK